MEQLRNAIFALPGHARPAWIFRRQFFEFPRGLIRLELDPTSPPPTCGFQRFSGKRTTTVVPVRGVESRRMVPPCSSTQRKALASPIPRCRPAGLAE